MKNEKEILKIYRNLYDSRCSEGDFGPNYKNLKDLMIINKMIENTPSGFSFTSKFRQKFFDYENFENWIDTNFFEPIEQEQKNRPKKGELKKYTNDTQIESVIKTLIPNIELIDLKIDPKNNNYYLIITKNDNEENDIWDTRLQNIKAYLLKVNEKLILPVDIGQSLVKYFPHIIKDLGYSDEAIIDMLTTKNWNNWRRYKGEDWNYLSEGIMPIKFDKSKFHIGDKVQFNVPWGRETGIITDTTPTYIEIQTELGKKFQIEDSKRTNLMRVNEEKIGKIEAFTGDYDLHKNPVSLVGFPNYVRGIVTSNGDFYLPSDNEIIHNEFIRDLQKNNYIKGSDDKKWYLDPKTYGFITVQRLGNTNIVNLGESNEKEIVQKQLNWILDILKKAKEKCPKIDFRCENSNVSAKDDPVTIKYTGGMMNYFRDNLNQNNDNNMNEYNIISLNDFLNEVDINYLVQMNRNKIDRPIAKPSEQSTLSSDRYNYDERKEGIDRINKQQQILKSMGYDLDTDTEDPLKAPTKKEVKIVQTNLEDYKNKIKNNRNYLAKQKLSSLKTAAMRAKYGEGKFNDLKKDYEKEERGLSKLYKKHNRDSMLDSYDSIIPTLEDFNKNNELIDKIVNLKKQLREINIEINTKEGNEYNNLLLKRQIEKKIFDLKKQIHDEMHINNEELLEMEGGKGDKKDPDSFDKDQLRLGIAVEMEHTNDPEIAADIAMDHLTENERYYIILVESGLVDEKEALDIYNEIMSINQGNTEDYYMGGLGYSDEQRFKMK